MGCAAVEGRTSMTFKEDGLQELLCLNVYVPGVPLVSSLPGSCLGLCPAKKSEGLVKNSGTSIWKLLPLYCNAIYLYSAYMGTTVPA